MRGTASPATLCRLAKNMGYEGMALTDCNNLYGLWSFVAACKREGLRSIIGADLEGTDRQRRVTCLVKNQQGYSNLCKLLTVRLTDKQFDLNFEQEIEKNAAGLLLLTNSRNCLQRWHRAGLQVAADLGPRPTEEGRILRKWALATGIPPVCTPGSSISHPDEYFLYMLLRAIAEKKTLAEIRCDYEKYKKVKRQQPYSLECPEEYASRFSIWPESLTNSEKLSELCQFGRPDFGIVMPPWHGRGDVAGVLRKQSYQGARKRYGDDLAEPVVERLEHELRVIHEMGFSSYFLVVRDIVHRKSENGKRQKRRICGRGSGAASLVAYCLEITNVCPIKYNLYFERFLNPGRTDPPDIDIDFSWDERDFVLKEVFSDYQDRVAMVCNHVFFQPKMAIRETARACGLSGSEISAVTKRLPWFRGHGTGMAGRLSRLPTMRGQDFSEPWPWILRYAEKLVGIPRYLSVHPGGVVITPKPVCHYVPVEMASKGVPIIHWEKDGTEEAGLVKIDLLGNRSLGVIRDAIADIRTGGQDFAEERWQPEDDPLTKDAVARGITMGCFYIESPAMRLLQQKAAVGDFEQLVIQSSIIRPAANEFVREYVRRLHGGSFGQLHPLLTDVLDESFGLMVYQEDVSRVAVKLAGFSHAQADGLRKVLSKKDRELRLPDYKESFYSGCMKKKIAEQIIDKVWQMILSFDGYSFCKPHSASYAKVSFQAAYLKSHFPAQFMAAVISNQGGYYSTFAYVSEARRLGVTILGPCVNKSKRKWSGKRKEIRVGLMAIKGLSDGLIERVVSLREKRQFTTPADFFYQTSPAIDEARALIHSGALDQLDQAGNRTALLWEFSRFKYVGSASRTSPLFGFSSPDPPVLPESEKLQLARREFAVLGFLVSCHPLQLLSQRILAGRMKISDLFGIKGRKVQVAGWLLTGKLVSTKKGDVMEFLTFEDESGLLETTFFPGVYQRYAHCLFSGRPYMLWGTVDKDYGAISLVVEKVRLLQNLAE